MSREVIFRASFPFTVSVPFQRQQISGRRGPDSSVQTPGWGRGEAVGAHRSLGTEPDLLAASEVGILDPPLSAGLGP